MKIVCGLVATFGLLLVAPVLAEDVDLQVIHRIKTEAFHNSQVMDYVFQLTDLNGPRLSGSPGHHKAADTAAKAMRDIGIRDASVVPWGKFGRSWSHRGVSVRMLSPIETSLSGVPMAWSSGTDGPVRGDVVLAPLFTDPDHPDLNDLEKIARRIVEYQQEYSGKLRDKIVMVEPARKFSLPTEPSGRRFDDTELSELYMAEAPGPYEPISWPLWRFPRDPEERARRSRATPVDFRSDFWERELAVNSRFYQFLADEGVAAVLMVDDRGDGGAIFSDSYGSWHPGAPVPAPTVTLSPEHFNRIARLLARDVAVELEVNIEAKFHSENVDGRNVIANIVGGKRRNELVMLGGHLDSWHSATGATDNASGCAIVMEAMRILTALDLKMDRTVRMALWDGEEQNYYGSRAYVKANFGDSVSMELKPDHARLSAYYNIDNGSGKIRGVYLQSNDMVRPIFEAWFAPFADQGVSTITIRDAFFTDHRIFDAVGLPGFQFVQDPLEYESRTHHSDLDTVDHLQPGDLMQAAAVLASVIYHTANRDELMPRKPLPQPGTRLQPSADHRAPARLPPQSSTRRRCRRYRWRAP